MKIRELLTDESKWTKGAYARDKNGLEMNNPTDPRACCWCLGGALLRCYPVDIDKRVEVRHKIVAVINKGRINQEFYTIVGGWNDAPERTFEQVRDLVVRLDI